MGKVNLWVCQRPSGNEGRLAGADPKVRPQMMQAGSNSALSLSCAPPVAMGGGQLQPEQSLNYSAGAVVEQGPFTFTSDYFRIDIGDRVALSQEINLTESEIQTLLAEGIPEARNFPVFRFFLNDFSTRLSSSVRNLMKNSGNARGKRLDGSPDSRSCISVYSASCSLCWKSAEDLTESRPSSPYRRIPKYHGQMVFPLVHKTSPGPTSRVFMRAE